MKKVVLTLLLGLVAVARGVADDSAAKAQGIRSLSSRHLRLYTDLVLDEDIRSLPQVFDLATAQWRSYFSIDSAKTSSWQMRACLIQDRQKFVQAGLLPDDLPSFRHGFSRGDELWLYEQPTPYYRRHLLLHEGTHGFMNSMLGNCGPPWYMEGMAELFATHAYGDGRLTMRHFPVRREEVPMLGRIKLVQEAVASQRGLSLPQILAYSNRAHVENEPYAWCWAVASLLDNHPRYRQRFRRLDKYVKQPDFTERFRRTFRNDWGRMIDEWRLFIGTLEHGHDIARTAIDFQLGAPMIGARSECTVEADRGWQNTLLRLEGGTTYRFGASGRYQLADRPQVWWCEPGGVTICYYRGRPLGLLLGTVWHDDHRSQESTPFLRPFVIGTGAEYRPRSSGTLYLKINDSPGELHDNQGKLQVVVTASG